jgi:hypothetical protein
MKTADAQNQNLLPGKGSMSPCRQTKPAAGKAATLPVTTVTEVHKTADRQLPGPARTRKYKGETVMKNKNQIITAAEVAAPSVEAGMSLPKYIDGLIESLGMAYKDLPQGVKNLFIYSKQGDNIALHHLGGLYVQDMFFPADHQISRRLRDEAAMHGNEVARRQQDKASGTWGLPIIISHGDGLEKAAWPAPSQTKEVKESQQDSEQTAPRDLAFRVA